MVGVVGVLVVEHLPREVQRRQRKEAGLREDEWVGVHCEGDSECVAGSE